MHNAAKASAAQVWEGAFWFAAAAENASDPRLKSPMAARARELGRRAKALANRNPVNPRGFDQDQCR